MALIGAREAHDIIIILICPLSGFENIRAESHRLNRLNLAVLSETLVFSLRLILYAAVSVDAIRSSVTAAP